MSRLALIAMTCLLAIGCAARDARVSTGEPYEQVLADVGQLIDRGELDAALALSGWLARQPDLSAEDASRAVVLRLVACLRSPVDACGAELRHQLLSEYRDSAGTEQQRLALMLAELLEELESSQRTVRSLREQRERLKKIDLERRP